MFLKKLNNWGKPVTRVYGLKEMVEASVDKNEAERPNYGKGATNPTVVLEPWTDAANSGIVLDMQGSLVAPKALAYRTKKSDQEEPALEVVQIEDLARDRETGWGHWVGFSGKPTVLFLFDVPGIAGKLAKLVIEILIDFKRPPITVEIVQ